MGGTLSLKVASIWALVASVVVLAVAGIFVLVFPDLPFEDEVLGTSALVAGYSVLGLALAVALGRGRVRPVLWGAGGCLGVSLAVWLMMIWLQPGWRNLDRFLQIGFTFMLIGGALMHAGLVAQMRLASPRAAGTRWGSIACAAVVVLSLLPVIWEIIDESDVGEWYPRGIGVFVILAALGTLLMLAFAPLDRLARDRLDDTTMSTRVEVSVVCPRCGASQRVRSGADARCESCRLAIRVEVAEPRCACGYLLLGLAGEVCPECGRPIDEKDRWNSGGAAS